MVGCCRHICLWGLDFQGAISLGEWKVICLFKKRHKDSEEIFRFVIFIFFFNIAYKNRIHVFQVAEKIGKERIYQNKRLYDLVKRVNDIIME